MSRKGAVLVALVAFALGIGTGVGGMLVRNRPSRPDLVLDRFDIAALLEQCKPPTAEFEIRPQTIRHETTHHAFYGFSKAAWKGPTAEGKVIETIQKQIGAFVVGKRGSFNQWSGVRPREYGCEFPESGLTGMVLVWLGRRANDDVWDVTICICVAQTGRE